MSFVIHTLLVVDEVHALNAQDYCDHTRNVMVA